MSSTKTEIILCLNDLEKLYGALELDKVEIYTKALAGFGFETLRKAVEKVIETHTTSRFPLPAVIIKAAGEVVSSGTAAEQTGANARYEAFRGNFELCEAAMRSHAGQIALQEGWGQFFWNDVLTGGQRDFDAEYIEKSTQSFENSKRMVGEVEITGSPFAKPFRSILDGAIEKNNALARKYWQGEHIRRDAA